MWQQKKNLFLNIFAGLRLGLITPLDLDETKAHPLLLILYGILHFCILFWFMFSNLWLKLFIKCVFSIGLNSDGALGGQAVSDQFSLGWDTVLVSLHSVIVARLDGRGSGFQGQRIRHEIHQRLGTVDVKDQLAALQYVLCVIPLLLHATFCTWSGWYSPEPYLVQAGLSSKLSPCRSGHCPCKL